MGNSNSQQLHLQLENHEKIFGGLQRERSWIGGLGGHHSLGPHHQLQRHGHLIVPLTDAVIQRKMLRNTENGQILQNEGTISQRRRSMRQSEEGSFTLNPNRRTLSDSDLSRKAFNHTPHADNGQHQSQAQKSVIAISPSKAKIKLRKNKGKAPDPPSIAVSEHPRDSRDSRDSIQRRFVRSNSSLCPRTWEHEFNGFNSNDNRSCRADSRADSRESRSRCPIQNGDSGNACMNGSYKSGHKAPSNRLTRSEAGLLRRPAHEKPVTGSTKSTTSLISQLSAGAKTSITGSKTPTKAKPTETTNSKVNKRDISDTPKPAAPIKPQFYFSNMDTLKKETSETGRKEKTSLKIGSVSKSTTAKSQVTGKTSAAKEVAKTSVDGTRITRAKPSAKDLNKPYGELPQPNVTAVNNSFSNNRITAQRRITVSVPTKKLPDLPIVKPPPKEDARREELVRKVQPNQIRKLVVQSARSSSSSSDSPTSNRSSEVRQRVPANDNVVFKVNPNFGQVLVSGNINHTNNNMSSINNNEISGNQDVNNFCVPHAATQILDDLDATLDNYSQLSAGRKSDDSDYCEPDERNVLSPPKPPLPTPVTFHAAQQQRPQPTVEVYAPRITPPKSLEMLFRPPSPKESKSLPPDKLNGLDVTTNVELTSLHAADKPPTPPPIPANWIKSSVSCRASISSSSEEDCGGTPDHENVHISVHIRPCLPRRPIATLMSGLTPLRFSPTHAWKSLDPAGSDGDRNSEGHKSLSDCELNFSSSSSSDEDRKEETPLKAHLSVDSGITSGYSNPHPHWTPKEDLIDTDTESTGGTEPSDISRCMFSLPNQARFTLPSMFLSQNSAGGIDSNWSFKSGPNSLQQKSQSFVYLPPPRNNDSTVNVQNRNSSNGSNNESNRRLSSAGRTSNHPSLSLGMWTY
ncbi:uncharacterized protein LOC111245791 [Varroa destructor]|uniref:Uncharacterized protein n=1 Tax=Varroa destructor TaxID=109461 RepID=A0A7M7JE07_VARDE|nr:uncharacterized protein LOC111245791 [Varroa destructor]XP_022650308.1 uncharacterized protein LOC111245791 [Varroa destructor]XP_022650309.1 uncharacterized protein LOC111245791 [Varroa destructor]XP_022650310.1 uncharacterized protein LOC111245791 [Varroa destructor]XP_022650311.1 uncharacterized protein LOC111245791 [Varroa destructor]XP_022650312.1 uncharacterized protein LOC111245791 [Varroa destructor]XP_022650314.1 uncharacterized protein LOC111245791 [Varroa destructor]XP_02265031